MTPATPRQAVLFVIVILGLVTVGGMAGIVWLAHDHIKIPVELASLTSASGGALAALLASTRTLPNDPPPVPKV